MHGIWAGAWLEKASAVGLVARHWMRRMRPSGRAWEDKASESRSACALPLLIAPMYRRTVVTTSGLPCYLHPAPLPLFPPPPHHTHTSPLCPPCQERKRKVAGDVPGGDQPDKPAKTSGSSAQQVSEGLRWGGTEVWGVQTSRRSKCERDRHR